MPARRIEPGRLPALRSAAQLFHRPADVRHPGDVARAICGAQAQDPYAGRLAFRARSARLRARDVDRARTEERSLLRAWAMRGTLHLLAADDADWLLPLYEPALVADSTRRLGQLGVAARTLERALRTLERALDAEGPLTRSELDERLVRKGIELDASQRLHLARLAVAGGVACLGPDRGSRTCLVLARDWVGERASHDRDAALAELARRYLGAFGPATEADFAGWSGLPLRDLRAGLARIASEVSEVRIGGDTAWTLRSGARRTRGRTVRLLPAWDTYLMGHRDRSFLVSREDWPKVMPGGGVLHPTVVVDGVAVATWRLKRGKGLTVELEPFAGLDDDVRAAVAAEVEDVGRFEGAAASLA